MRSVFAAAFVRCVLNVLLDRFDLVLFFVPLVLFGLVLLFTPLVLFDLVPRRGRDLDAGQFRQVLYGQARGPGDG